MKIPNVRLPRGSSFLSLARIVSEDSQLDVATYDVFDKSSKDS